MGSRVRLKIDCNYDNGVTVSWAMSAVFPRVPCVGEMVEIRKNIDGSGIEGEPICDSVDYVWWDIIAGEAAATVYLKDSRMAGHYLGQDDWMTKQGWLAEHRRGL